MIAINDPRNLIAINAANDPDDSRSCADALIEFWIQGEVVPDPDDDDFDETKDYFTGNRPYSSGEVASALRSHRPDLRFSVGGIGSHCRDRFYGDTLPAYPSTGLPPVQVSRMTDGLYPDRTPADVEVFVYAPDQQAGYDHTFEVYIPVPGQTVDDAPVAQPAKDRTQPGQSIVAILGAKVAVTEIRANVRPDGRIEIPRNAFELCVHMSGKAMRGGDSVYATRKNDVVTIYQTDPGTPSNEYKLSASAGRVIVSPTALGGIPVSPGNKYIVEVGAGTLALDLSCPL